MVAKLGGLWHLASMASALGWGLPAIRSGCTGWAWSSSETVLTVDLDLTWVSSIPDEPQAGPGREKGQRPGREFQQTRRSSGAKATSDDAALWSV